MKFCQRCGKDMMDDAMVCPACGFSQMPNQPVAPAGPVTTDSSSFGWGLLGFCFPIVGLILFLIWKDSTPLKAKSAGMGALISTIISVVFYIIYFIIIAAAVGTGSMYY